MKNSVYINDDGLFRLIITLTEEPLDKCSEILDFLNDINPSHMYYRTTSVDAMDRILFFDNDYKYEVFGINKTYHDVIKIFDHVFKTKLLFKNLKVIKDSDDYFGNIVLDNEILMTRLVQKYNLDRFNVVKFFRASLALRIDADESEIEIDNKKSTDRILYFNCNNNTYELNIEKKEIEFSELI